jgi:hypothetical protein
METRFERFTLRIMIACFVAMMAFAPATLLAGGSEKKAEGKDGVIASTTSEQGKKDKMKDSEDKKEKEDAGAKKGEK